MFRIAFLLALVSTNALACGEYDWRCTLHEAVREKEASDRAESQRWDQTLQAQRDYDQRERLSLDEDRRQSLIEGQMNQLNMNTVPRY